MWRGLALAAIVLLGLTGCAAHPDDPTIAVGSVLPTASVDPASPQATPRASVSAWVSATAPADDLVRFDRVARAVVAANSAARGRAFIDALVRAGFRKSAMQVTPDTTSIGLAAPSVQFSVLVDGSCLIGQYGPKSGGYHGLATTPVAGRCLIGRTRTIDW